MDYDWFHCGTSGGACPGPDGGDFGYSPETFPHPVQQLQAFHDEYHLRFAGIRKPRTFDHLDLCKSQGWILDSGGSTGFSGNNLNYSTAAMREWYTNNSLHFFRDGIDYWWNDEGETQTFTYQWWNQAQQQEWALVRPGERMFTINRAFTPGLQAFPAVVWSGDDQDCSHAMALSFVAKGMLYATCDMRDNHDAVALLRQYQNAVFLPIMRVHQMHGRPRFPYLWANGSAELEEAFRQALRLRYALIPHLYSLAHRQFRQLIPMTRDAASIFGPFPRQGGNAVGTYLLGDTLLPADYDMIEGVGNTSDPSAATIAFPPGLWLPFNTSGAPGSAAVVSGPATRHFHPALGEIPLFVRDSSIVVLAEGQAQYTDELGGVLEVQVYRQGPSTPPIPSFNFTFFEDDGHSLAYASLPTAVRAVVFTYSPETGTLSWAQTGPAAVFSRWPQIQAVRFPDGARSQPTAFAETGKVELK